MKRLWRLAVTLKVPVVVQADRRWADSYKQRRAISAILHDKSVVYNAWIEDGHLDMDRMKEGSVVYNTTIVHNRVLLAGPTEELFPAWLTNPSPN